MGVACATNHAMVAVWFAAVASRKEKASPGLRRQFFAGIRKSSAASGVRICGVTAKFVIDDPRPGIGLDATTCWRHGRVCI